MSKIHSKLADRLADILFKLNQGERLQEQSLAAEYKVSLRTIQRDLRHRLALLPWNECGPYYSLESSYLGNFSLSDIQRFARYASVQQLFPSIDRQFYKQNLMNSIDVRGFNYEDISQKKDEFKALQAAVLDCNYVQFEYQARTGKQKVYFVQPYRMLNKAGIWYLMALHDSKLKAFCFTKMSQQQISLQNFVPDSAVLEKINQSDSIYLEENIASVTIAVAAEVAYYFQRRTIVPNQQQLIQLADGSLQITCNNLHQREIFSVILYWLPHLRIISPSSLQQKLTADLENYLQNNQLKDKN